MKLDRLHMVAHAQRLSQALQKESGLWVMFDLPENNLEVEIAENSGLGMVTNDRLWFKMVK